MLFTFSHKPMFYEGFHQTDVIRAKAYVSRHTTTSSLTMYRIDRLEGLIDAGDPYYIQIAPAGPHSAPDGPAVPCSRHMYAYNQAKAPRTPNWNPSDEYQNQKPFWLKDLPRMDDDMSDFTDFQFRSRQQTLLGVDELVEDVVEYLREKDQLDNTYSECQWII